MKLKLTLNDKKRLNEKNTFDGNLVFGNRKFHLSTHRKKIFGGPSTELLSLA